MTVVPRQMFPPPHSASSVQAAPTFSGCPGPQRQALLGIKHVQGTFEDPGLGQSALVRHPVTPSVELDGLVVVHVAAHTKPAKTMIGVFERR